MTIQVRLQPLDRNGFSTKGRFVDLSAHEEYIILVVPDEAKSIKVRGDDLLRAVKFLMQEQK